MLGYDDGPARFSGGAAGATYQPGRGVQDAAAPRLGLGFGQVAVQGQQLESGQQDAATMAAVSHAALTLKSKDGKWPSPVPLPVRISASIPAVDIEHQSRTDRTTLP